MVLTPNYAKRVDSENAPPPLKSKSLHGSHVRSSVHAASRRRRARTTGSSHNPRHIVEQAKRRSLTKSPPTTIRFEFRPAPIVETMKDVEMKDAEPLSKPTSSVTLPRYLTRPEYREVSKESLAVADAELAEVPMDYIREGLEVVGPGMMKVLAGVRADPIKNTLPKELSIIINDLSSDMPTHMLAIYTRQPPSSSRRRVTLFPVHNVVFASYCASLPQLPPSSPVPFPETSGSKISLPIVPLCIPSPETFPQLSAYLYTKRTDHLLSSLLPSSPPLGFPTSLDPDELDKNAPIYKFAYKLALTYTTHALLQYAMSINGFWRNVCALGIFDDALWNMLDVAWEVILHAIAAGTGNIPALQAAAISV